MNLNPSDKQDQKKDKKDQKTDKKEKKDDKNKEKKNDKSEPTEYVSPHFERVNVYYSDQFTDVPSNQWYTKNVAEVFELGLMKGNRGLFKPYGDVTVAEAVTLASRIHRIHENGSEDFVQSPGEWYRVYLDYALKNEIIGNAFYNSEVSHKITRAQFAAILSKTLPDECFEPMNNVSDGAIPDVSMEDRYAADIYKLYRSGILSGSDANGTFNPSTFITRAEAAAIISRIVESENRVKITLD